MALYMYEGHYIIITIQLSSAEWNIATLRVVMNMLFNKKKCAKVVLLLPSALERGIGSRTVGQG